MSKPIDYVAEGEENEALRWRDAEITALRAALKRCHGLIETARSLLRVDASTEQWHEDAEAELSLCDEAGECPALAAAREGEKP